MPDWETLSLQAQSWGHPWIFMGISLSFLPSTLLRLVRDGRIADLTSWHRLRAAWFADFWATVGPRVRERCEPLVVPLLRGRVRAGAVLPDDDDDSEAAPPLSGTVLEIGPGTGMWVSLFTPEKLAGPDEDLRDPDGAARRRRPSPPPAVTRVLGIEPNASVHAELRARVDAAGLAAVYEVVPVGIEDLERTGRVPLESVDCVVAILCLCGIPDPQRNIRHLYRYLKPGGRMYVYEHVRIRRTQWLLALYQGEKRRLAALLACFLPQLTHGLFCL